MCDSEACYIYGVRIIEHYTEVSEVSSPDVSFYISRDQTCCIFAMIFCFPPFF